MPVEETFKARIAAKREKTAAKKNAQAGPIFKEVEQASQRTRKFQVKEGKIKKF